ncbi:MAG: hypothetical protein ACKEQK_00405 [Candidatus Hodgkinia cicadicola]
MDMLMNSVFIMVREFRFWFVGRTIKTRIMLDVFVRLANLLVSWGSQPEVIANVIRLANWEVVLGVVLRIWNGRFLGFASMGTMFADD